MERSKRFSIVVMIILPGIFIAVDVVLALNSVKGDTYSEIITQLWWQAPIVGLAVVVLFGTLSGHWFKPKELAIPDAKVVARRNKVAHALAIFFSITFLVTFLAGYYWW